MTNRTKHARPSGVKKTSQDQAMRLCFTVLMAFAVLQPESTFAAAQPWDNVVATITGIFTGGLGRSIAILVVIGLGISAFFGKLSWKLAGGFIGGIVLIFGAAAIADFFIAGV